MKKNLFTFLYTTLLMFAAQSNPAIAQLPAADLVKLLQGTNYEISNVAEIYTIRIPITLESTVKAIKISIIGVSFGNRSGQELTRAFKVSLENASPSENVEPALLVAVSTRDLEQGKYRLLINVQPEDSTDNSKNQRLDLELTLPAAKIQQPETLAIQQTVLPFGQVTVGDPTLLLQETSGKQTRLDNILIEPIALADENNLSPAASISFDQPPSLEPGKIEKTKISLSGSFPLGTTKGKALIKSPQMTESIIVPFEIKARRHWGYIIVFIIFGLILGFAVRIWAQRVIDLDDIRRTADEAIDSLKQKLDLHPDSTLAKKINTVIAQIKAAQKGKKVQAIESAITEANTTVAEALKDLDTRRAEALTLIKTLTRLTSVRNSLPKEFAPVFDIKSGLERAQQEITSENVAAARQTLDGLITMIMEKINETLTNWKPGIEDLLKELSNISPILATPALEQRLTQKLDEFSPILAKINHLSNLDPTLEEVKQIVSDLIDFQLKIKEFILFLQSSILSTLMSLKNRFNSITTTNKSALDEFFEKVGQFQKKIAEWGEFSSTKMVEVKDEISDLKANWEKAMLAQLENEESVKQSVENLFAAENFREATLEIIKHLLAISNDDFLGGTPPADAEAADADFSDTAPLTTGISVQDLSVSTVPLAETSPPILGILNVDSLSNVILAKILRFLVAGIGIVAVGYILFADKFIGTFPDLMAVFVWAFGLDITVDTFVNAGKKLKN